jgi:hypothetical protein
MMVLQEYLWSKGWSAMSALLRQRSGSGGDSNARFEHESPRIRLAVDMDRLHHDSESLVDVWVDLIAVLRWSSSAPCRSQGEERKKMEMMTAVKWVPPVGDRAKRYAPWALGGLADGPRWWASVHWPVFPLFSVSFLFPFSIFCFEFSN